MGSILTVPIRRVLLIVKMRDVNGLWSEPDTVVVSYGLTRSVSMAPIPAGTFIMGSENGRFNEKPLHTVTISAFKFMSADITNEFYDLLLGYRPPADRDSSLCPARAMTWYDAVYFCNLASKRMGLDTCYTFSAMSMSGKNCVSMSNITCDFQKNGFRLPTEAEWEYAARAGTTTKYYWGDTIDTSYCWYIENSANRTRPVGLKLPNAWGLYDMLGNITMWVNDAFGSYTADAQINPIGPDINLKLHGQRGGSVFDVLGYGPDGLTCSFRDNGDPDLIYYYNGFRMVQSN
jgi:formylglycine-generating enzyme required for sulfatase activity